MCNALSNKANPAFSALMACTQAKAGFGIEVSQHHGGHFVNQAVERCTPAGGQGTLSRQCLSSDEADGECGHVRLLQKCFGCHGLQLGKEPLSAAQITHIAG